MYPSTKIANNNIGNEGMQILSTTTAKHLPFLQRLRIGNYLFIYSGGNDISGIGMSMMPESYFHQLMSLQICILINYELGNFNIGSVGTKLIIKA